MLPDNVLSVLQPSQIPANISFSFKKGSRENY